MESNYHYGGFGYGKPFLCSLLGKKTTMLPFMLCWLQLISSLFGTVLYFWTHFSHEKISFIGTKSKVAIVNIQSSPIL
mgnify:CR=1 FL=1